MTPSEAGADKRVAAVSDQTLRTIAEQGFFVKACSLADARAACAELIFARTMIAAQTATLAELTSQLALGAKRAA